MTLRAYTPGSFTPFDKYCEYWEEEFLSAPRVFATHWQSQDISSKPEMAPRELQNTSFAVILSDTPDGLAAQVVPNLPWAEDHFQERVGGVPLNPPPSEAWWPFAQQGNASHKEGQEFSHTYPERFWPKWANKGYDSSGIFQNPGIRYQLGDLDDLVEQLKRDPLGRQAYLPVWFPEDTGATEGQRVPCTLGYHFMIRGSKLTITYYIRSCDYMRHFRDDVYMAGRLAQWVAAQVDIQIDSLELVMHMASFHVFEGDLPELKRRQQQRIADKHARLLAAL